MSASVKKLATEIGPIVEKHGFTLTTIDNTKYNRVQIWVDFFASRKGSYLDLIRLEDALNEELPYDVEVHPESTRHAMTQNNVADNDPGNLITSLTIDNILSRNVGPVLEAIRDAGYQVEINVSDTPT